MSTTPPIITRIPDEIVAGNKYLIDISQGDYLPATWTLRFNATRLGEGVFSLTGADQGNGKWRLFLVSTLTVTFTEDQVYAWELVVDDGTDFINLERGQFKAIRSRRDEGTGVEARTRAQRMVDRLEQMIEDKLDRAAYSVGDLSLSQFSFAELNDELRRWKRIVNYERERERARRGLSTTRAIKQRFLRVSS